jgi:cellulose synthase/poly-beta-1,6-N-acetylglucosamine synthase-like glycosyltransferase
LINIILFLYAAFIVILFFYSIHAFILIYRHLKFNKKRPRRRRRKLTTLPNVTIQLPIYNEKYVIRRLLKCITSMDYPTKNLEIQVIDDSDDNTTSIVAKLVKQYQKDNYDIKHIRRGSRAGFKAGALQYGLERAKGDYIAIFDADFVPPPNFLKELLPEFGERNIGGVQARWGHLNSDYSFLTKSQAIGLDNHFLMEQRLRSQANWFINFNGTCGLWLKRAIIDAGGWHDDTLAEDLDLSYRVQLRGWIIKFRDDVVVPGELPHNAYSYRIQQNRWAKGTIQVARKLLIRVLKSPLKPIAKYEAFVHLTCHINFVAMLGLAVFSLPIVYFKIEGMVPDSYYIFLSFFTVSAFGYPFVYYLSQRQAYRDYYRKIPYIIGVVAYSMGLSISNTNAIIEGWFHKKHVFTRTPKYGDSKKTYRPETKSIIPFLEVLLGIYVLVNLIYVIANLQIILIPFLFLYSLGFLSLGLSSIRDDILSLRTQEVLCSRENS